MSLKRIIPLLLFIPSFLIASDLPSKEEQILQLLGYEETLSYRFEVLNQRLHETMDTFLGPEEIETYEKELRQILSWETIKPDLIAELHGSYTEAELDKLICMLQSPDTQLLLESVSLCGVRLENIYTRRMDEVTELLKNSPPNQAFAPPNISEAVRIDILTNGTIYDKEGNQLTMEQLEELVESSIAQGRDAFIVNSMNTTRMGHVMVVVDLIKAKGASTVSLSSF